MIWDSTPTPEIGDTRKSHRFSFLPTKIGNQWYWLEFYEVEQLYISRADDYWVDNKWWFCGRLIENKNIPVTPSTPPNPNIYKNGHLK
jgi:hypothetical protein